MTKIYIDADGCPVKDEVYRVAERYKLPVVLVANKRLNLPMNSLLEMVVVTGAFDAADDWIVENSKPNDIVVTADILLADRCVKKSVRVLGPKGVELTADISAPQSRRNAVRTRSTAAFLFALDVHGVVGYRLRGNFLEPVGRLCRNRNHVAFAQMVSRSAFDRGSAHLIRRGTLGVNHGPSHH